jgi:hypothetical protein
MALYAVTQPRSTVFEGQRQDLAASVKYLQNYLITFYPLRLDSNEQLHQRARDLGGQLEVPRLLESARGSTNWRVGAELSAVNRS